MSSTKEPKYKSVGFPQGESVGVINVTTRFSMGENDLGLSASLVVRGQYYGKTAGALNQSDGRKLAGSGLSTGLENVDSLTLDVFPTGDGKPVQLELKPTDSAWVDVTDNQPVFPMSDTTKPNIYEGPKENRVLVREVNDPDWRARIEYLLSGPVLQACGLKPAKATKQTITQIKENAYGAARLALENALTSAGQSAAQVAAALKSFDAANDADSAARKAGSDARKAAHAKVVAG